MKYKIIIADKKSEKLLTKLPTNIQDLIAEALLLLEDNPRPKGIKQLKKNVFRLRKGNYRIIYEVDDIAVKVFITKIAKRDESTYKNFN